jgi:hypothetical protein
MDLIDGDNFAVKLKILSLGIETQKIETERAMNNTDWFLNI